MLDLLISPAQATASSGIGSGITQQITQFAPFILIFVAFYFFLIRPQQKRAQQQREMLSAISKGDRILTSGGLIGTIVRVVNDEEVLLEISEGVQVRLMRSMISKNFSTAGSSNGAPQDSTRKSSSNVKSLADAKKKVVKKLPTTRRKTTTKK